MAKNEKFGGAGAAGMFFSDQTVMSQGDDSDQETSKNVYTNDTKPEARSKRTNILIQPSLYQKASEKASEQGISVNELFIRAIVEYLSTH